MKALSHCLSWGVVKKTSANHPKGKTSADGSGDPRDAPRHRTDSQGGKGPRVATIGTRRKVNQMRWNKLMARRPPPPQPPGSPRAPQKMGIRLGFTRDPSAHMLRNGKQALNKRLDARAFTDRVRPHHCELVKLAEALSVWDKVSRDTDKRAPQGRVNLDSIAGFFQSLDAELAAVQKAIQAQERAVSSTASCFTGDRAWLRAVGRRLQTQKAHLQNTRQQLQDALAGKGMSAQDIQPYVNAGIPITPQTRDLAYMPGHFVVGPQSHSEKGGVHHVEFLQVRAIDPATREERLVPKVFKGEPAKMMLPEAAGMTQITVPRLSCRAVAASKVSDAMGLHLIPMTELALKGDGLGVVMDVAPGDALQSKGRALLPVSEDVRQWAADNPRDLVLFAQARGYGGAELKGQTIEFKRETTSLVYDENGDAVSDGDKALMVTAPADIQASPNVLLGSPMAVAQLAGANCFNFLINSSDAHMGNCAFGPDGVLRYFDNDISFGRHFPDLASVGPGIDAVHHTYLPDVIPTRMHDAVLALTPDRLKAQLTGLLDAQEIQAACDRLATLQLHCGQCAQEGKVLNDDDPAWGSQQVQQTLGLDRIVAARGDLSALEALGPDLTRRNVPARYLLGLCITEARTQAHQDRKRPLDSTEAVTFDPVAMHAALVEVSSPAVVAV